MWSCRMSTFTGDGDAERTGIGRDGAVSKTDLPDIEKWFAVQRHHSLDTFQHSGIDQFAGSRGGLFRGLKDESDIALRPGSFEQFSLFSHGAGSEEGHRGMGVMPAGMAAAIIGRTPGHVLEIRDGDAVNVGSEGDP